MSLASQGAEFHSIFYKFEQRIIRYNVMARGLVAQFG
jgi:hypothetical protein